MRRRLRLEIALVIVVSLVVLAPGISGYSLVDPWETHYGEVARMMLQNHDYVHMEWPQDNEGFRSKPVLMFWMMAAGMKAVGVGADGGYSGEMADSTRVMIGIRLPFILSAIAGLTLMWWMLARLVSRRLAWLALLVVGSTPIFCMLARQAIPDMPMVATTIGAVALFTMAVEDGDRAIKPLAFRGFRYDARHIVLAIAAGFVIVQALYYAYYFATSPQLALRGRFPSPAIWLPLAMLWALSGLSRDGWVLCLWRLPCVLLGGVIATIVNEPVPQRRAGQSAWRHLFDDLLRSWERHAIDRYLVRALPLSAAVALVAANLLAFVPGFVNYLGTAGIIATAVIWALAIAGGGWAATDELADRILGMAPITTMRQLYLLGCYFLLGVSLLAKGPPGFAVVIGVGFFHVVLFHRWKALYEGGFEIKRGLLLMAVVAIPWHVGMWLKEGVRFVDEYFYTHILNRAGSVVDNSPGTFEYYTSQIGHGMWLWAALLPAALAAALLRANRETREGRVRFMIALWAIVAMATFALVETKFHHYILPAIPPLGLLVACLLDDVAGRRERLHPLYALLGVGIVLLVCRDLMHEPKRWIEMFVYRYDRPWPSVEPYLIDPSDGFFALGIAASVALIIASTRFVRIGVVAIGLAGLAICVWSLQIYMPLAGKHWGMREAARTYYKQRAIYGEKIIYFGDAELADEWEDAGDQHTFLTFVPDSLQLGQPMTLTIQVAKPGPEDERITEQELVLVGSVTSIGDHSVELTLAPGERAKLGPLIARGAKSNKRGRPPIHVVDADRLIAWQLYWRGENFWSGDEIWGWPPEMKTAFVKNDNVELGKYLNDKTRAPVGRRYFVITEASKITGIRSLLPTQRGRESFEVIDTTSNKFSLAAFYQ
jgi:4-amino-4-deoxy-L-arabinose transferase-like glycosyltransferase